MSPNKDLVAFIIGLRFFKLYYNIILGAKCMLENAYLSVVNWC